MSRASSPNAIVPTKAGLNRQTAKQLASLSALAAAALAMGAGEAQATIIWSGPITSGNTVGIAFGPTTSFYKTRTSVLPGGLGPAKPRFEALAGSASPGFAVGIAGLTAAQTFPGNFGPGFYFLDVTGVTSFGLGFVKGFKKGATFFGPLLSSTATVRPGVQLAAVAHGSAHDFTAEDFITKTAPYALFAFGTSSGGHDFGWANLGLLATHTSHSGRYAVELTVNSYAYQDDGLPIAAGDVPEPSSGALELTALAAFVIGGPAVRRWRAGRRAQRLAESGTAPA